MKKENPWIGVDLDGTLAVSDGDYSDPLKIGAPVPAMLERVKKWISAGKDVRIFTARAAPGRDTALNRLAIETWCIKHFGKILPITNAKDPEMEQLWDDRAVQVERNTGKRCDGATDDEPKKV